MCVKEFIGFSCGHCTIPTLRQCPLTSQNENFPACKFPAERVTQFEEMCHPCFRVVWKDNVLEEERRHKTLHEQRLCECEIMFTDEERQRRMGRKTPRSKGKTRDRTSRHRSDGMEEMGRRSLANNGYGQLAFEPAELEAEQNEVEHRGYHAYGLRDVVKPSSQMPNMKWYPMNTEGEQYQYSTSDEMLLRPAFGMAPAQSSPLAYQPQQYQQQGVVTPPFYHLSPTEVPIPISTPNYAPPSAEAYYVRQPSLAPTHPIEYRSPLVVISNARGYNVGESRSSSTPP